MSSQTSMKRSMKPASKSDSLGTSVMNYMWIWLVLIPVAVWIILYTIKPNFVTDLVNGTYVINNQKLFLWTIVISLIAFAVIYLIYNYGGMDWKLNCGK